MYHLGRKMVIERCSIYSYTMKGILRTIQNIFRSLTQIKSHRIFPLCTMFIFVFLKSVWLHGKVYRVSFFPIFYSAWYIYTPCFYILPISISYNQYTFSDCFRYEHLSRGWRCRVYQNLDKVEALRVASLHRCGQPAVDKPCLQEEVAVCRSILYDDNNLDVEDEPCTMTASTRRKCSLALGENGSFNVSLNTRADIFIWHFHLDKMLNSFNVLFLLVAK